VKKIYLLCILLFFSNILFAQSEITGLNVVSKHFGQSFSQLISSIPKGAVTESRDNLFYIFNYPLNNYTSLFFIDPKKGVNHYVIFAHTENSLSDYYKYLLNIFIELYGDYTNFESSVFFYSNLPENISRIELSKPESDTENRNVLLIRWYGF
jgi:hypothetical protein